EAIRLKKIAHRCVVPVEEVFLKDASGDVAGDPDCDSARRMWRPREMIVVMALCDKNLRQRVAECLNQGLPGIPASELLSHMEEVAKGIDFLNSPVHDLGNARPQAIIHRDVKPENILLTGESARICLCGLTRPRTRSTTSDNERVAFSLAYASPETLKENLPGPATDQYSLAVCYYEMRTGKTPFASDATNWDMIVAHVRGQLQFDGVSSPEATVLRQAASANPQNRFGSAREMVQALKKAVADASPDPAGQVAVAPDADLQPSPPATDEIPNADLFATFHVQAEAVLDSPAQAKADPPAGVPPTPDAPARDASQPRTSVPELSDLSDTMVERLQQLRAGGHIGFG
ncbi:MAG: protein kinase, partial [Planctomycetales bacterium]